MAVIMDGRALARSYKERIAAQTAVMSHPPALAVILVGNDPASRTYVTNKEKDCAECGIISKEYALSVDTKEEDLLSLLEKLNRQPEIDGVLVQLPLPAGISEDKVIAAINPSKDVDAFHPYNVGLIATGNPQFLPCTPAGILALLDAYSIEIAGKHCVMVGRSNIVGKPMSLLLLGRNGTITICHSQTPDLPHITRMADILVTAVGRRDLITGSMVKEGAVVVDVAMNRDENGKFCGDVLFDEVMPKTSFITPVPGGVGPMTRIMLLENTLTAARLHGKA
ncbi:MAG: bifunctional 5,10-methylenetetrahydrofolate dehydrogenase/5,10-methenyltetrahydrofolate cyclohydrolase [Oscillospiraceae bacterium]|nr:bifunctional 5,10-methylenetetrahydrofolate dehydrogenase/5,10-methenyltetrahydrofolate cyclohydrolase [Oscillospiraceae bacterium]